MCIRETHLILDDRIHLQEKDIQTYLEKEKKRKQNKTNKMKG